MHKIRPSNIHNDSSQRSYEIPTPLFNKEKDAFSSQFMFKDHYKHYDKLHDNYGRKIQSSVSSPGQESGSSSSGSDESSGSETLGRVNSSSSESTNKKNSIFNPSHKAFSKVQYDNGLFTSLGSNGLHAPGYIFGINPGFQKLDMGRQQYPSSPFNIGSLFAINFQPPVNSKQRHSHESNMGYQ